MGVQSLQSVSGLAFVLGRVIAAEDGRAIIAGRFRCWNVAGLRIDTPLPCPGRKGFCHRFFRAVLSYTMRLTPVSIDSATSSRKAWRPEVFLSTAKQIRPKRECRSKEEAAVIPPRGGTPVYPFRSAKCLPAGNYRRTTREIIHKFPTRKSSVYTKVAIGYRADVIAPMQVA